MIKVSWLKPKWIYSHASCLRLEKREQEKEERHGSPPYIIIVAAKKDFIDLVTLILHYNTPSQLFNISFINAKSPQTSPVIKFNIKYKRSTYFFLKINHSLMTKLKIPEKIKAKRLQTTTLKPAKWRMSTKGIILIRKAAIQDMLYGRKRLK